MIEKTFDASQKKCFFLFCIAIGSDGLCFLTAEFLHINRFQFLLPQWRGSF